MNTHPFLQKLLNGQAVEWRTLGEIATFYGGLTGKNKHDFENGNAKYITYKNIFGNIEINPNHLEMVKVSENEKQHQVKYGDILFTGSSEIAEEAGMSSAVTTHFDEPVYLNSFSFGIRFHDGIEITPEFAKFLFRSHFIRREIIKTASGVTRFNVSKERFKKIQIPIPPLSVQTEIVRILDTFTALTAELTHELALRQKQYQYYRDLLLTFDDINLAGGGSNPLFGQNVVWKTLGELGELIRGNGLTKKDFTADGVPAIHYGQIYTHYGLSANKTISFVSSEVAQKLRKVNTGDVVITNTSENLEDVGKALVYLGKEQAVTGGHATIFRPHKQILAKYFVHFTQTKYFFDAKRKLAKGTKVIDVSTTDMAKIKIPIPPLSTQAKIVAILDKFDTLTHSITDGLPREIELRRKQYEYYREQLLEFPKLCV